MRISRKSFIKNVGLSGLLGMVSWQQFIKAADADRISLIGEENKTLTFLFQGDSITSGGRSRNNDWNHVMGHGYAYLVASQLWYDYVNMGLMFYNRGVSGDKIKDLDARWEQDTLALKPDVISILIGVNDVESIIAKENTIENWRKTYENVLNRTKHSLPKTQIILCEPFVLPDNWTSEKTRAFEIVISEMQRVIRELAVKYDTMFVELQQHFNSAYKNSSKKYWVWDGIHPMPAGHELMARLWIGQVQKKIDF